MTSNALDVCMLWSNDSTIRHYFVDLLLAAIPSFLGNSWASSFQINQQL